MFSVQNVLIFSAHSSMILSCILMLRAFLTAIPQPSWPGQPRMTLRLISIPSCSIVLQVSGASITFGGVSSALIAGSEFVKGLGGAV